MMRKTIVTAVGSAILGGLGVGYLTLGPVANADRTTIVDDSTDTTAAGTDTSTETSTDPSTDTPNPPIDKGERFTTHIEEALAPLLADGTLTQAQIDKVVTALADARPADGKGPKGRGRGPGRGGPMGENRAEVIALVSTTIGVTADELTTALKSGQTIAEVAAAKGVDAKKVIDALVLQATQSIDQRVADGTLTAERAADIKANLVERTTRFVNEGRKGRHGPKDGQTSPAETPDDQGS